MTWRPRFYALILVALSGFALVTSYYVLPRAVGATGRAAVFVRVPAMFAVAKMIQVLMRRPVFQRMREREFRAVLAATETRVVRSLERAQATGSRRAVKRARNAVANLRRYARPTFTGPGYPEAASVADELEARIASTGQEVVRGSS